MKMRNLVLAAAAMACFSAAAAPEAAARNALFAVLNGGNECNGASPPTCRVGDPDGVGSANVFIFGPNNLCATIIVDNLVIPNGAAPNAAHIHRGAETVNGGVVVTLAAPFNNGFGNPGTSMICNNAVPAPIINQLRVDPQNFYINVHNAAFPAGAVRGQLF